MLSSPIESLTLDLFYFFDAFGAGVAALSAAGAGAAVAGVAEALAAGAVCAAAAEAGVADAPGAGVGEALEPVGVAAAAGNESRTERVSGRESKVKTMQVTPKITAE